MMGMATRLYLALLPFCRVSVEKFVVSAVKPYAQVTWLM
jgi:hypothetical protein